MRILLPAFLMLSSLAISSQAAAITESFTGTVVNNDGTSSSFYGPPIGSAVSGTVTFNTGAMFPFGDLYTGGVSIVTTDVNGTLSSTGSDNNETAFINDAAYDSIQISLIDKVGNTYPTYFLDLNFASGTLKTYSPADLPISSPLIDYPTGSVSNSSEGFVFDVSTFAPASPTIAPEPGTVGMITLAGLGGLLVRRLRPNCNKMVSK